MPVIMRAAYVALFIAVGLGRVTGAETSIDLSPQVKPNDLTRVSIQLDAGGSMLVRAERDDAGAIGPEQRLPMSVSAKLEYSERRLTGGANTAGDRGSMAVRFYEVADAVIKVDQGGVTPQLSDDRRLIVVESGISRPTLYCPGAQLSREELDLIEVVGNSCVVDQLLPEKPVADGEAWASRPDVIAALLTLDTVAVCEVQSVLEEFNASFAKVRLAGVVHGTSDGAATELEVRGVYLFDRGQRRIKRLNLAVREQRSIGGATPGVDAVAKLQIKIDPLQGAPQLGDQAVAEITRAGRRPVLDLVYEAPTMGFRLQHDRQWFVTSRQRESVTLRRVGGSELVAHCTLAVLPPKAPGRQTSLEQFQKDVVFSLGQNFGELVSARQWQNAHSHYCYELVLRGTVAELPVEWHYYLVAREGGHRLSAAVTINGPMVERLAGVDRALIERLELFPPMPAAETAGRDRGPTK